MARNRDAPGWEPQDALPHHRGSHAPWYVRLGWFLRGTAQALLDWLRGTGPPGTAGHRLRQWVVLCVMVAVALGVPCVLFLPLLWWILHMLAACAALLRELLASLLQAAMMLVGLVILLAILGAAAKHEKERRG